MRCHYVCGDIAVTSQLKTLPQISEIGLSYARHEIGYESPAHDEHARESSMFQDHPYSVLVTAIAFLLIVGSKV